MRFYDAKVSVARVAGDQGNEDRREIAGDAIRAAIRDWNTEHNWEFKFREDPSYTLASGDQDIEVDGLKKVHTLRRTGDAKGVLQFYRMRTIDYSLRDQSSVGIPTVYTVIENPTQNVVRVYPVPETDTDFHVSYYEEIQEPSDDDDEIDVPTRFLNALLARAKYHYLMDKDSENIRLQLYDTLSSTLLRKAIRDDKKQPDEIEGMPSRNDYGYAFGRLEEDF